MDVCEEVTKVRPARCLEGCGLLLRPYWRRILPVCCGQSALVGRAHPLPRVFPRDEGEGHILTSQQTSPRSSDVFNAPKEELVQAD